MSVNKILIEGLDRLGKDTLINGILNARGFHQVMHFSKPMALDCYAPDPSGLTAAEIKQEQLIEYQTRSFRTMFSILRDATYARVICNRAHLGECVYAPLYRGYSGDYVFEMEHSFEMHKNNQTRLILLVEDFAIAEHFIDDGESFDITKRRQEQDLFLEAFHSSLIPDKRVICVTDKATGGFRHKEQILAEALS